MPKKYIILGFVVLLVIIVISVFAASNSTVKTVSPDDPNRPIAKVEETSFDLGKMNEKDTKDHEFKITNTGKSNLVLSEMSTSCMCTYGYIIKSDGTKSPQFSMHGGFDNKTEVAPGDSVMAQVIYQPSLMPVEGPVERYASIGTNDPNMPKVELEVKADVAK